MATDKKHTLIPSGGAVPTVRPTEGDAGDIDPLADAGDPAPVPVGGAGSDRPNRWALVSAELRKRPGIVALMAVPVLLLVLIALAPSGGGETSTATTTTNPAPASTTTVVEGPASAVNSDYLVLPGQRTLLVGAPEGAVLYGRTWIAEAGQTLSAPATVWGEDVEVSGWQWERCDPAQTNCELIEDGNEATYVVPALPSRTELRVLVEVEDKELVIVSSAVQIP